MLATKGTRWETQKIVKPAAIQRKEESDGGAGEGISARMPTAPRFRVAMSRNVDGVSIVAALVYRHDVLLADLQTARGGVDEAWPRRAGGGGVVVVGCRSQGHPAI